MLNEDCVYIIGHINPDADSIASAMGYAWLLKRRDGLNAIAARAGALNPQTVWILKHLELEIPLLITDASPHFGSIVRRLATVNPESKLSEAWGIASHTGGIVPVVSDDGKPFGLINGYTLFRFLQQSIGPRLDRNEKRIIDLLSTPSKNAAEKNVPKFPVHMHIRDALNRILREEQNDFFVIDEKEQYLGVCSQRDALNPPRLKLILVDHNEPRQSIASLDEAELLEVLDHHRLGNPYTHQPIRFTVDVVGSTSTLVVEQTTESGFCMPSALAGLLLAGLLVDTLMLKSPTTTPRDKSAAEQLSRWAFISGSPLRNEDIQSFGQQVMHAGTGLANRDPIEIVSTDIKIYEASGYKFAIAQAEVSDLTQIAEYLSGLRDALNDLRNKRGMDFSMLLITDVVSGSSRLLISQPEPHILDDLPYPQLSDGSRQAEGVVSRKKQLLPVVLGHLEK